MVTNLIKSGERRQQIFKDNENSEQYKQQLKKNRGKL